MLPWNRPTPSEETQSDRTYQLKKRIDNAVSNGKFWKSAWWYQINDPLDKEVWFGIYRHTGQIKLVKEFWET